MKPSTFVFATAALLFATHQNARPDDLVAKQVDFCESLRSVRDGDRLHVVLEGVLVVGEEHALLYDPQNYDCHGRIQPSAWVDLKAVQGNEELSRLLATDRRANVVVEGVLWGPPTAGVDDVSLPLSVSYLKRATNRRYGHLNSFRTKLVVERVASVQAVSPDLPWLATWHKPEIGPLPEVLDAALPKYPRRAIQLGISGTVHFLLNIRDGKVERVDSIIGDRLLAEAAVENVRTWKFDRRVVGSMAVEYVFEFFLSGEDISATRIELELPRVVRVSTSRRLW